MVTDRAARCALSQSRSVVVYRKLDSLKRTRRPPCRIGSLAHLSDASDTLLMKLLFHTAVPGADQTRLHIRRVLSGDAWTEILNEEDKLVPSSEEDLWKAIEESNPGASVQSALSSLP